MNLDGLRDVWREDAYHIPMEQRERIARACQDEEGIDLALIDGLMEHGVDPTHIAWYVFDAQEVRRYMFQEARLARHYASAKLALEKYSRRPDVQARKQRVRQGWLIARQEMLIHTLREYGREGRWPDMKAIRRQVGLHLLYPPELR